MWSQVKNTLGILKNFVRFLKSWQEDSLAADDLTVRISSCRGGGNRQNVGPGSKFFRPELQRPGGMVPPV